MRMTLNIMYDLNLNLVLATIEANICHRVSKNLIEQRKYIMYLLIVLYKYKGRSNLNHTLCTHQICSTATFPYELSPGTKSPISAPLSKP